MMLVNIFNAHAQAIDLRFMQKKVQYKLSHLFTKYDIKVYELANVYVGVLIFGKRKL